MPPSPLKRFTALLLLQAGSVPLVPASSSATITTVAFDSSAAQPPIPATSYRNVYVPGCRAAVLKKLPASCPVGVPCSVHVPVRSNGAAITLKRSTLGVPWQMVMLPSPPAFGAWLTTTVTMALESAQGAVPATVYT